MAYSATWPTLNLGRLIWPVGIAFAAVATGAVATMASERMIWLLAGAAAGMVLLAYPLALMWATTWYALVGTGMLIYFAGLQEADWLLTAAAAPFWLIALTAPLTAQRRTHHERTAGAPPFMWMLTLYLILALATSLTNAESVAQVLVGLKYYVLMFGVALALYVVDWDRQAIVRLCGGVMAIGLVQLPVCLYQFLVVRRHRLAVGGRFSGDSEVEASDSVVGTMGGSPMAGGLSDMLALLLCVLLATTLTMYYKRLLSTRWAVALATALLIPLLITENKIIVVYIPLLMILVAAEAIRKNPMKSLIGMVVGLLCIPVVLFAYYKIHWSTQYPTFEEAILRMSVYNVQPASGDLRREGQLGRTEAVEYWAQHQRLETIEYTLFGHGLAAAKAGSRSVQSRLIKQHGGIKLNFTGLSTLLWEVGIVGTGALLAALAMAFLAAGRLARSARLTPHEQCIIKTVQVAIAMFPISLAYQNTFVSWGHASFALFFTLGLVAFYSRVAARNVAS
jgi:hypothetical protein